MILEEQVNKEIITEIFLPLKHSNIETFKYVSTFHAVKLIALFFICTVRKMKRHFPR